MIQKEALEKAAREGKGPPVPQANPLERPVRGSGTGRALEEVALGPVLSQRAGGRASRTRRRDPRAAGRRPANRSTARTGPAASRRRRAAGSTAGAGQCSGGRRSRRECASASTRTAAAEQPKKRPFWKLWGN